jgi:NAD(P)-dependent dehydrogenase (short-subunit alcohol dehydrogenase family)
VLTDKVIVITGGAGLLGRQFCETVVSNNGTAVVADISEEHSGDVKKELLEKYPNAIVDIASIDIINKESILKAIKDVSSRFGQIDALVNNAYPKNKNYGKKFEDVSYEDFCENLNQHLGGYFLTSQQFIEFFKSQGHGNIINMSSIYGVVAPRFELYKGTSMTMPVEYAAIKAALIHLTRYMASYTRGSNIRVNAISPGGILDGQPESFLENYNAQCLTKGMLEQNDINGSLLFLLSDLSAAINGQNIIVDDGYTL